ncbi:MAG TPA: hypothetical protein VJN18_18230 [Polyangiaceae bacterium]|nr:hypothetical protein [Polyangiaceae bacterium]
MSVDLDWRAHVGVDIGWCACVGVGWCAHVGSAVGPRARVRFAPSLDAPIGVDLHLRSGGGTGINPRAHVGAHDVDATNVLRIACCHLDDLWPDVDQLAISLHGPAPEAKERNQRG